MEPIDPQALASVRGGFGALLGLLQAAPAFINGITGLIGVLKGSGGTATASAQPQPQPTMTTPPAATGATPSQMQTAAADPTGGAGACRSCCDPIGASSVTNIIRIG